MSAVDVPTEKAVDLSSRSPAAVAVSTEHNAFDGKGMEGLQQREGRTMSTSPPPLRAGAATRNDISTDASASGVEVTAPAPTTTSTDDVSVSGFFQCWALMRKNGLQRMRTPLATFMEVFSPVLMMLVLVLAYRMSEITHEDAARYDTVEFDLPGPWLDWLDVGRKIVVSRGGGGADSAAAGPLQQAQQPPQDTAMRRELTSFISPFSGESRISGKEDETRFSHRLWHSWPAPPDVLDVLPRPPLSSSGSPRPTNGRDRREEWEAEALRRELQSHEDDDENDDENDDEKSVKEMTSRMNNSSIDMYVVLDGMRRQMRRLLKNPVTVPTFSQYVGLSAALRSLVDADDLPRVFSDSSFGRQFGNLLTLGTLHLAPVNVDEDGDINTSSTSTSVAMDFWRHLNETYPLLMTTNTSATVRVRVHASEADAMAYIDGRHDRERAWALLDFSDWPADTGSGGDDVRYKIRMNYTTLPHTSMITDWVAVGLNTNYQRYYLSGYLTLQRTLNEFALIRASAAAAAGSDGDGQQQPNVCSELVRNGTTGSLWSMAMPTASYSQNTFYLAVGYLLGLTIAISYLYPVARLIAMMVTEKESRMKETLFVLGVRPAAHWWSWFLTSLLLFSIISVLVTATLSSSVLMYSDAAYLLAWIFLFGTASIGFCFMLASFFSRAKLAAILGPMALFATILPRYIFFGYNRYEAVNAKMWASLFAATAFSFGADIVADYEYAGQGVQSWNAGDGAYSFRTALAFLLFDTLLYVFLGWYLDQVLPRQYGAPQKWYFLFTPSFWCGSCCRSDEDDNDEQQQQRPAEDDTDGSFHRDNQRVTDPSLVPRVEIRDLVKVYNVGGNCCRNNNRSDGRIPAVNHLNLTMYESQITALLGHNGAGKSTTVSLLTGLYKSTSGDCFVYGKSITKQTERARRSIGICQQQNVLFDNLTVLEQIRFFQRIRGVRAGAPEAKALADEMGLGDYYHTTASALSGGTKRKLCVAIALSGDARFIILDEPTTGMDPASRRACWDVLRRKRLGRVILLTTHFMDEAELLSDRIAVVSAGVLQCSGTPLFLKNRFGLGYNMTVVLEQQRPRQQQFPTDDDAAAEEGVEGETEYSPTRETDSDAALVEQQQVRLLRFFRHYIPGAVLARKFGKELTFRLPKGCESLFPAAFDALELERRNLSVGAFGIDNASLEEVFILLAEQKEAAINEERPDASASGAVSKNELFEDGRVEDASAMDPDEPAAEAPPSSSPSSPLVEYKHLSPLKQLNLLYWNKRWTIQKRDPKGFIFAVVAPVLLVALVLLILTVNFPIVGPAVEVSPALYATSADGRAGVTDVLVGGGASLGNGSSSGAAEMASRYFHLTSLLHRRYPNAVFRRRHDDLSSSDLSRYLLDSYNEHDHNVRYGAFALRDLINLRVRVDWGEVQDDVRPLLDGLEGIIEPIDFVEMLSGQRDGFAWNATVSELADWFFAATGLDPDAGGTIRGVRNLTQSALEVILSPSTQDDNSNQASNVSEWERTIRDFVNQSLVAAREIDANSTLLVDALANALTEGARLFNETSQNNATFEDIISSLLNQTTTGPWNDTVFETFVYASDSFFGQVRFNASVVRRELEAMLRGFSRMFGLPDLVEAPDPMLQFLEGSERSATALTAGLVAADAVLEEVILTSGGNASFGFADLFGGLNAALGGSESDLDGYILVEASSVTFVPSSGTIILRGIEVATKNRTLVSVQNETLSLNFSMQDFKALFPSSGPVDYEFKIPSEATVLHNSSSPHAVAAFNQAYMEFLFKTCTGNANASLVSVNHPLPLTTQQSIEVRTVLSIFASMFILIPYCYIPGAFIVFLVKEKSSKSKHLQLVSGVSMSAYWIASYIWDLTLFLMLTVLVMLVFLAYGKESAAVFVGDVESFFCTMALTFGYGLSVLPFSYLLARGFSNHSSAQIAVMGLVFITGFVAVNAYFIMDSIEKTKQIAQALRPLFRMWPAYNVGEGLIAMSSAYWNREILSVYQRPFDWDVAGKPVALLYLLSLPYFVLLLLLEYSHDGGAGGMMGRLLRSVRGAWERAVLRWYGVRREAGVFALEGDGLNDHRNARDQDVEEERLFVTQQVDELKQSAPVLYADLWKIYPPSIGLFGAVMASLRRFIVSSCCFCCRVRSSESSPNNEQREERRGAFLPKRAVRGVTTAVREGELFGLLGPNGAGKSSSLAVLTGDVTPTNGQVYVAGHDVTGAEPNGVTEARKHIGFCPQVDPLLELMTGRETLRMFARLRGVPAAHLESEVSSLLDHLTLTPHADKTSETYSGGNKRKLSLGIALIGNPKVLLIDESSSGLDPVAKRRMWNLISEVSRNRSVILTTHSMQEAEALCTRAGIVSAGQLLCLGSVQHLKTKFLDGYTIDIFCESACSENQVDEVIFELLRNALPGSRLAERHGRFLRLDVPSLSSLGLGTTFRRLEALKQSHQWLVENYSISQCSLEQVFIKLVDGVAGLNQEGADTDQSTDAGGSANNSVAGSETVQASGTGIVRPAVGEKVCS